MTSSRFHYFAIFATLLASLHSTGLAANYVRPNESKELFQLEKIPLRVDSMKEISRQLIVLAQRPQDDSPAQLRASAQLLALAMRLNPTSQDARKIDKAFSKNKIQSPVTEQQILKAQSSLRVYSRWLSSADAGSNANLLANCLADASKTLSPDTLNNADTANWAGIVPKIEKYTSTPNQPKPDTETKPPVNEKNTAPPTQPNPSSRQFHLTEVTLHAPLTTEITKKYRDPASNFETRYRTTKTQSISPITLKISIEASRNNTAEISFSPTWPSERVEENKRSIQQKTYSLLKKSLTKRHNTLPEGKAVFNIPQGGYSLSNRLAITAPAAMMLEASLTNQPLRNDIHVCAAINANGEFIQPSNFGPLIGILRQSDTGGRLIVSSQSAQLLTQLLVYSEPDFFTRWEVFTADSLDQAMAAAVKSSPKNIAEASAYFETIRQLTEKSDVTKLAVNRAVRKRLLDIFALAPNHISAKILLIQGGGKRPMRLNEAALAHELRPILNSIDKTLSSTSGQNLPSSNKLKSIHGKLRGDIDPLAKIVNSAHDDNYQETLKLANEFRRLASISRRISSDYMQHSTLSKSADSIIFSMQGECAALKAKVEAIIAGYK